MTNDQLNAAAARIEVYPPGAWVRIGDNVAATVRKVCIEEGRWSYEVVWWDGRTRHTQWLSPHEISGDAPTALEIGFATAPARARVEAAVAAMEGKCQ